MKSTRKNLKSRLSFFDEWRGLVIILMILYHGAYDIVYVFGVNAPFFNWKITSNTQLFIAGSFIFLAGISCRFSKNNLKRGFQVFGIAMLMSVITFFIMYDQRILFGVLHFLGSAMIIFALTSSILEKLPTIFGIFLMFALWLLTKGIPEGLIGLQGVLTFELPAVLYSTKYLFPLGFPGAGFYSSDYFPIIPNIFWFLTGSYVGELFTRRNVPRFFYTQRIKPLAWLGRRSMVIYVLHQPLLYVGILLILKIWNKIAV